MDMEKYMREALSLAAEAAAEGEIPVGCVVVDGSGNIIGRGRNRREERRSITGHAEIEALEAAAALRGDWRMDDCTAFVTLEPCPMCAGAMVMAQLDACVFGAYDEKQGCCGSVYDLPHDPAFYHRTQCMGGVMEEECAALLKAFFTKKR